MRLLHCWYSLQSSERRSCGQTDKRTWALHHSEVPPAVPYRATPSQNTTIFHDTCNCWDAGQYESDSFRDDSACLCLYQTAVSLNPCQTVFIWLVSASWVSQWFILLQLQTTNFLHLTVIIPQIFRNCYSWTYSAYTGLLRGTDFKVAADRSETHFKSPLHTLR